MVQEITNTVLCFITGLVGVVYFFKISDWEDGWLARIVLIGFEALLALKVVAILALNYGWV